LVITTNHKRKEEREEGREANTSFSQAPLYLPAVSHGTQGGLTTRSYFSNQNWSAWFDNGLKHFNWNYPGKRRTQSCPRDNKNSMNFKLGAVRGLP
jgi:hypothetical protein